MICSRKQWAKIRFPRSYMLIRTQFKVLIMIIYHDHDHNHSHIILTRIILYQPNIIDLLLRRIFLAGDSCLCMYMYMYMYMYVCIYIYPLVI